MASIPFFKYQGTGNDFVMIDNRGTKFLDRTDEGKIQLMCDRRFGIGADGLILLQNKAGYDFEMVYFNADGRESSMCGNGGRCTVAFAKFLGIIENECQFLAVDGGHQAKISAEDWVELKMSDVKKVETGDGFFVLDTGSPHYVVFVEDLDDINITEGGQAIRYSDRFRKEGINVDFAEQVHGSLKVATYERGVEAETLSCGTGVTAAAISFFLKNKNPPFREVPISTKGGELSVRFLPDGNGGFRDIWLCGPARQVFSGEYAI